MGKTHDQLDQRLRPWITERHMFLVAPSGSGGHVNLAPKGRADTLATLDERTVAYLDLTGSGAETIAHPRDNGRITPHVLRLVRAAADPAPPRAGTDRPARRAAMGRRRPAAGC